MNSMKRYNCPCCNYKTFDAPIQESIGDICPVCFWEIDFFIKNENSPSGANSGLTLKQARKNFIDFGACEKSMLKYVRKPLLEELNNF